MRRKSLVSFAVLAVFALATALVAAPPSPDPAPSAVQPAAAPQTAPQTTACPAEASETIVFDLEDQTLMAAGEPCGGVVCGKFEYCCNPTCNACLPYGMSCTQQVCN